MLARIREDTQPNLVLLSYSSRYHVETLSLIPSIFLIEQIVEQRKPLAETARRAGWVGCNLLIGNIPEDGRISYVMNGKITAPHAIRSLWRRSRFIENVDAGSRGWLVSVMACIDKLGKREFTLGDVYAFEPILQNQFPNNRNIRPKIRQQIQVLRDRGWLTFLGRGRYHLTE